MKFVTVRELRGRSAQIWKRLNEEGDLIVTSNGKPVAILSQVSEENLEQSVKAIRRARAEEAVLALQLTSVESGRGRVSGKEINEEIAAIRRKRHR